MAKEEKPIPYQSRILDTKGVAQRLDLRYLSKPNRFNDLRRKLTWIAPLVAAIACIPFLTGIGPLDKVFSNGPVSKSHALFEQNCQLCHAQAFSKVADATCVQCHDGASHPAKMIDTGKPNREVRCATCHEEHRGSSELKAVANRNCTTCHASLKENGTGIQLTSVVISAFKEGKHPNFPQPGLVDSRPLKLNHAIHMPKDAKTIRGMKLPMKCTECHTTSANLASGGLEPVTFDKNCMQCHKRELEFVLPGLAVEAAPAPHTKDAPKIRQFILETYQNLAAANPSLTRRPLDRDMNPEPNAAAWIAKATKMSEEYLFNHKCKYCHEYAAMDGSFPVIRKVNRIQGRYVESKPEGEPWLQRAEFSHRAHRALDCAGCHAQAKTSTKTSDVLIAGMKDCTACHGASGTQIDNCSTCHAYHNKSKEQDHDRRSVQQLIGKLFSIPSQGSY